MAIAPASALDGDAVEIVGFGDCLLLADPGDEASGHVRIGQAELDVIAAVDERTEMAAAVAFDTEGEAFGLGAFTIERSLLSEGEGVVDDVGFLVGRFDVPFGLDWRVYPSLDRRMISAPLAVEMPHCYWNDVGAQGYVRAGPADVVLFAVNDMPHDAVVAKSGLAMTDVRHAVGGRLGLRVAEGLELGSSSAWQVDRSGGSPLNLVGFDAVWSWGGLEAKGEFIRQDYGREFGFAGSGEGYYVQTTQRFGRHRLGMRFDRFVWSDGDGLDRRWCFGVARIVSEATEWRVERRVGLDAAPDDMMMQLVTAF